MRDGLPAGIMPDPRAQLPELLLRNEGRWVRHEGVRPGVYRHLTADGDQCVTVRVQMPPNGILSSASYRRLADLVERYAQVGRRTSRNAFELVGVDPLRVDGLVAELNALGYPVGGTGNSLHQIKSCGGFVACQNAAVDSPSLAKAIGDRFFGDVVAQGYPAWLKVSIGGCPNQCGGGVEADIGLLGVFKGLPQVDDARLVESQCDVPLLCFWCPTGAIKPKPVRGGMSVEINAERCTRCTSCANVCPAGIHMGGQRGVAVAVGGSSSNTRRGPRLARLLVPFIPMESQMECEAVLQLVGRVIDLWKGSARRGERLGDFVDRIGWPAFFRRAGVAFDPYLIDNFDPLSVRRNLQMRWDSQDGRCR
ncbi:MAG: 4Fe-4S dicluster domain-containing protein [Chloroflexota bacterium]